MLSLRIVRHDFRLWANEKAPALFRAGADLRDLFVLQIGGPWPKIRSSTPTIRIASASAPRPIAEATTSESREAAAGAASFMVPFIVVETTCSAATRQASFMLRVNIRVIKWGVNR